MIISWFMKEQKKKSLHALLTPFPIPTADITCCYYINYGGLTLNDKVC